MVDRAVDAGSRIIVALDFPTLPAALAFAERIRPEMARLKVGKELFTAAGPALVEALAGRGFDVFLDLKYHDIPNTVAGACRAAAGLGVWMLNVHASGGRAMMLAARDALGAAPRRPLLTAVTVLTSLADADLQEIGVSGGVAAQVMRLATLASDCGLDGVVCSAREARELRERLGKGFALVTPGIRPRDAAIGDQQRVMTPAQAVQAGADYLVIGRPVTGAPDPLHALEIIREEIRPYLGA